MKKLFVSLFSVLTLTFGAITTANAVDVYIGSYNGADYYFNTDKTEFTGDRGQDVVTYIKKVRNGELLKYSWAHIYRYYVNGQVRIESRVYSDIDVLRPIWTNVLNYYGK